MDVEDWIVLSQQRIARAVLQEGKDDLGTLIWLMWMLAALLGILFFLAVL